MQQLFAHIDPLYVLSGVLVGALVGFTGVGGGSLMTPILILVFGIHPSTAVGTDLLYASVTKTGGSIVHGYNKTIDWKVVGRLALGSVPMTALSVLALYYLGVDSKAVQGLITKTLGVALLFTAISLFMRKPLMEWYDRRIGEPNPAVVTRLTILTGAILGVLVTLSSVGAGRHRRDGAGDALSQDARAAHRRLRHRPRRAADVARGARPFDPGHDQLAHPHLAALRLAARDRGGVYRLGAHVRHGRARGAGRGAAAGGAAVLAVVRLKASSKLFPTCHPGSQVRRQGTARARDSWRHTL